MIDYNSSDAPLRSDPMMADAIRAVLGGTPCHEVDWERLEWRIMAASASALRASRVPDQWWSYTASWARAVGLAAFAASAAAVMALSVSRSQTASPDGYADVISAHGALFGSAASALRTGAVPDGASRDLLDELTAPARADWLMSQVLTPDGDTRVMK